MGSSTQPSRYYFSAVSAHSPRTQSTLSVVFQSLRDSPNSLTPWNRIHFAARARAPFLILEVNPQTRTTRTPGTRMQCLAHLCLPRLAVSRRSLRRTAPPPLKRLGL